MQFTSGRRTVAGGGQGEKSGVANRVNGCSGLDLIRKDEAR